MAYVVSRPNGRFEIRESVHTQKGPRARSLANFSLLTDDVLARAAGRATRPFDAGAVLGAARRAGAPTPTATPTTMPTGAPTTMPTGAPTTTTTNGPRDEPGRPRRTFVTSSRRMARSLGTRPAAGRPDPGDALIDLLGFVAQITPFRPARAPEPLRFPPLARLRAERSGVESHR
jgi:hypothetical protein